MMKTFFLYALADFKHSLHCLLFFCVRNAGDGFLWWNYDCSVIVLLYTALIFSDLD
jgi:hypothetical protein